ncbi:RNA-guided endonuclease InsQ/TnpB family protein [Methylorubrum zatmanii]
MQQRWTFRAYPTPEQEQILARTFGCVRYVYNWALSARTKAFKEGGRMSYVDTDRSLTVLKRQQETVWLNEVSSVPLQQALRDLQSAFSAFFGKRARYPAFKRKGDRAAARFTKSGFRFSDGGRLNIAKLGMLRIRWSRRLPSPPSSVTVIREASGRYFVSFVVEKEDAALPATGKQVGIDFGVARLATLSTGETIANPKHAYTRASRLALLQRRLAKKQRGSKRRMLAKKAVARAHERIANARKDALNKFTTRLVREFDVIHIEDLNLRGMVKNHALARSLSDAGIGMAVRMLKEKAERYGRSVIRVDRWFPSSKTCSECGHVISALPLQIRSWNCLACGSVHDRDLNAAKNILAVGQTVAAHGDGVRAA